MEKVDWQANACPEDIALVLKQRSKQNRKLRFCRSAAAQPKARQPSWIEAAGADSTDNVSRWSQIPPHETGDKLAEDKPNTDAIV
jgi:hypothetical protein